MTPRGWTIKGAFVPHRLEMLESVAWRAMPVPLRRMIERLEIEHMRHAGSQNGRLYVSYGQFVSAGISRRVIKASIIAGQRLGLLEVGQSFVMTSGDLREPTRYRLTFLPAHNGNAPTDEWKTISQARADRIINEYTARTSKSKGLKRQLKNTKAA